MKKLSAFVVVFGLLAVPAAAQTTESPCTEQRAGGEWTRYGQDQLGQNRQDAETTIGKDNVASLAEVWRTPSPTGYDSAPPIVAGGCVIINSGGRILAMDLDDGSTVWETQGVDTTSGFAVTVVDGRVHAAFPNGGKPRAAAFDVRDGSTLWVSEDVSFGEPANQLASGVVHDGIQAFFTTGPDFEPAARQGYALLDAATGEILHKQTTLTQEELDAGLQRRRRLGHAERRSRDRLPLRAHVESRVEDQGARVGQRDPEDRPRA